MRFHKVLMIIIFGIIICSFLFTLITRISNCKSGKKNWVITYNCAKQCEETYVTDFIEKNGCIYFTDIYGLEGSACGNYSKSQSLF